MTAPISADEARRRVFDETSLHADIIKTWGEHGAHNDVFTAMRHQAHDLAAEVERLSADNEALREALRIAHMHALQGGYGGQEDADDCRLVRTALGAVFAAALSDEGEK